MDYCGQRYLVPEEISCTRGESQWPRLRAATQTSRWSPVHMTCVAEDCMECTIIVCQLVGRTERERLRGAIGGWNGLPALATWRKSLLLLHLSCEETTRHDSRETLPGVPGIQRGYIPLPTSMDQYLSYLDCFSAQERGYRGWTSNSTLWFYLCDHREDMRKWNGKPTSALEAQVLELQEKTITNKGSSRKIAAPISSGLFPRQSVIIESVGAWRSYGILHCSTWKST